MTPPLQSAIRDIMAASNEDPQSVVKQALAAIVDFAEDKDAFCSPQAVRNFEESVSHGDDHATIARLRRRVDESSLDGIQVLLKDAWAEHTG